MSPAVKAQNLHSPHMPYSLFSSLGAMEDGGVPGRDGESGGAGVHVYVEGAVGGGRFG